MPFRTQNGVRVPAVTADQMREADRIAEEFGLSIPPEAYRQLGLSFKPFFGSRYLLRLERETL